MPKNTMAATDNIHTGEYASMNRSHAGHPAIVAITGFVVLLSCFWSSVSFFRWRGTWMAAPAKKKRRYNAASRLGAEVMHASACTVLRRSTHPARGGLVQAPGSVPQSAAALLSEELKQALQPHAYAEVWVPSRPWLHPAHHALPRDPCFGFSFSFLFAFFRSGRQGEDAAADLALTGSSSKKRKRVEEPADKPRLSKKREKALRKLLERRLEKRKGGKRERENDREREREAGKATIGCFLIFFVFFGVFLSSSFSSS